MKQMKKLSNKEMYEIAKPFWSDIPPFEAFKTVPFPFLIHGIKAHKGTQEWTITQMTSQGTVNVDIYDDDEQRYVDAGVLICESGKWQRYA